MPTDTVWVLVTIPRKEYEISLDESTFSLEEVLEKCLTEHDINDVVWMPTKSGKTLHVYFPVDLYDYEYTLQLLLKKGIGVKDQTSIGFIPFSMYYSNEETLTDDEPDLNEKYSTESLEGSENMGSKRSLQKTMTGFKRVQGDFIRSVTSRLTVAQVVAGVRSSSQLTFDFVMYTVFSGCIAAAGILNNSPVDIAAAMMIEPVMATVMAASFGCVIRDWSLLKLGVRSNVIVLLICLIIGYVYGLIAFNWSQTWNPPPAGVWPTPEMVVRGVGRTLWYGALQACAAGSAIALVLLNNNQAALVGVAVAATFLPPFINTGLLWAYTTHLQIRGLYQNPTHINISGKVYFLKPAWTPMKGYIPVYNMDMRYECLTLSGVSVLYTLVNVFCMFIMCCFWLKIKEVAPLGKKEPNKRFFQEDIKVYRSYKQLVSDEEHIGRRILQEWAEISGIDPAVLLSSQPAARVTQLQTLEEIINTVQQDGVYKTVTENSLGRPQVDMLRRMTVTNLAPTRASRTSSRSRSLGRSKSASTASGGQRQTVWSTSSPSNETDTGDEIDFSELSYRRLKPTEIRGRGRRQSLLPRKSLQEADHHPHSVWPQPWPSRFKLRSIRGGSGWRRFFENESTHL